MGIWVQKEHHEEDTHDPAEDDDDHNGFYPKLDMFFVAEIKYEPEQKGCQDRVGWNVIINEGLPNEKTFFSVNLPNEASKITSMYIF